MLEKLRTWKSASFDYPSFQCNLYFDVIIKEDGIEIGRWTDKVELPALSDVTAYPQKLQDMCAVAWAGL